MPRSGYDPDSYDWSKEYYQIGLRDIRDVQFHQHTFAPLPALVARRANNGYREEVEYWGQEFDPESWEVVEGRWDHHHCLVCRFKITTGHTYWENGDEMIVCDVCHDHIRAR